MSWKDIFPKENRYFETKNGILYCGDCLEIMKKFPEESIDLILTDPPYQISKKHNFDKMKDRKKKRTGTFFGNWDYFNIKIWKFVTKLISKNGSIVSFMAFEQYGEFFKILTSCGFDIKDKIIWEKTNPFPRNRDRRYVPNIELIVWCVRKGAKWTFNRQNSKYESCVLKFPSESGARFKRFHPTQKPLELLEYLVKTYSNEGDLVLDFTCGSGTTLVACEKLNRRWIGIEINPDYCKIAKERIENVIRRK